MTTATALVTLADTHTSEHLPTDRLAVAVATFNLLCRESGVEWLSGGAPAREVLHITKGDDDAAELDALDDVLRDRAQTVGGFVGGECFALFPGQGIDGCDVWARCRVEEIVEAQTVAEMGV